MFNSWVGVLINSQASQAGPSNTTTETSVLPAAAKFTIPANFFQNIGTVVRVTLCAAVSNVASSPGTLNIKVKFGSNIAFDGGLQQLSTTVHTSLPFWWQALLTVQVVGASAAFKGQGIAMGQMCLRSGADLATDGTEMSPNSAPANSATWDSTASQVMDLTATHSVSTAGTSTTSHQYVVEVLN
jgi:hypothetical protein